ncbi:hypothetical protein ACVBEH_13035 [Roseateles sp. GG27B]
MLVGCASAEALGLGVDMVRLRRLRPGDEGNKAQTWAQQLSTWPPPNAVRSEQRVHRRADGWAVWPSATACRNDQRLDHGSAYDAVVAAADVIDIDTTDAKIDHLGLACWWMTATTFLATTRWCCTDWMYRAFPRPGRCKVAQHRHAACRDERARVAGLTST